MTRKTPIPLLYPGYKKGLRTPIQHQFSLEQARCSNSISHSNKLYFSLTRSHVWKFFSNPCPDHDTTFYDLMDVARQGPLSMGFPR